MFERMNEYLKALGIDSDIRDLMKDRTENSRVEYLFTAINEVISAEDRLNDKANRVKSDMERLQKKLTEPMACVNSLGEDQQAAQLNALCGEYEARKSTLTMVAHMIKKER